MRFPPLDDNVDPYNCSFEDDLLGRAKLGEVLSQILDRIEDPLVVALDGRWGTGKSHFLKRWVGTRCNQNDDKAVTVYYDAFANDYLSDPLISLIGSMAERINKYEPKGIENLKKAALKLIKPATRFGLSLATYGASEASTGLCAVFAGAAGDSAKRALDDFWERETGRQEAMREFRDSVKKLLPDPGQEKAKPLIIVIDELDRCRPDFALEVLEVVKHFFSVPNVHFILGVNLNALEFSVKARYGNKFEAMAYLQKFLSFTFALPEDIGDNARTPSIVSYIYEKGKEMGIPSKQLKEIRDQVAVLSRCNNISIRDAGKILAMAAILPDTEQNNLDRTWSIILTTLLIAKVLFPEILQKLLDGSLSDRELRDFLGINKEGPLPIPPKNPPDHNFEMEEATLYLHWGKVLHEEVEDPMLLQERRRGPGKLYEEYIDLFKLPQY